eukprot:jgi/Galph1/440/GphlegSOOS_G5279.1
MEEESIRREDEQRTSRPGPPDISGTYSLLVLNISFRTGPNDLTPLFDKYGEVVDCYIPRNRRNGNSRGFAFVRFRKEEDARKAMEQMDGKEIDGRQITVQFAKYGRGEERRDRRDYRGRPSRPYHRSSRSGPRYREDDSYRRRRSRSPDRSRHPHRRHSRSPPRRRSPRRSRTPPRRRREERDYDHQAGNGHYSEERMRDIDEKEVVYERK